MSDLEAILITAFISIAVTILTSALAFRIGIENRLTTVETTLDQHPPIATADRLRLVEGRLCSLEEDARSIAPLRAILLQFGEGNIRETIRKGAGP
jgi:hypothetical protein